MLILQILLEFRVEDFWSPDCSSGNPWSPALVTEGFFKGILLSCLNVSDSISVRNKLTATVMLFPSDKAAQFQ